MPKTMSPMSSAHIAQESGLDSDFALLARDLDAVEEVLSRFLAGQASSSPATESAELVGWVRRALAGGKRFRPLLCCAGWRAAGGEGPLPGAVARVAASLELFHTFAVLHDDVMDRSPTRRGQPTAQFLVAARHAGLRRADEIGVNTAILLGDIAVGWSYELAYEAGLDPRTAQRVWRALAEMRTETAVGQYLDLMGIDAGNPGNVELALRTARGKTAAYTVAWPLRVGAMMAGACSPVTEMLTEFGLAVGEAFQLRDDLLNVFGDPGTTGKPAGDDLCNGKNTVLLAIAWRNAAQGQRQRLASLTGKPYLDEAELAEARSVFIATGARREVEGMISACLRRALTAIESAGLPPGPVAALTRLARNATARDR